MGPILYVVRSFIADSAGQAHGRGALTSDLVPLPTANLAIGFSYLPYLSALADERVYRRINAPRPLIGKVSVYYCGCASNVAMYRVGNEYADQLLLKVKSGVLWMALVVPWKIEEPTTTVRDLLHVSRMLYECEPAGMPVSLDGAVMAHGTLHNMIHVCTEDSAMEVPALYDETRVTVRHKNGTKIVSYERSVTVPDLLESYQGTSVLFALLPAPGTPLLPLAPVVGSVL